jgi:hypothetical protein
MPVGVVKDLGLCLNTTVCNTVVMGTPEHPHRGIPTTGEMTVHLTNMAYTSMDVAGMFAR